MTYQPAYPQQPPPDFQRRQDEDHLRLLAIFHYVWGGLTLAYSLFFGLYLAIGVFALSNPAAFDNKGSAQSDPAGAQFMGTVFTAMGAIGMVFALGLGGLTIWAGRCLARRERFNLCFAMACINCLGVPVGTVLGVFTLVVLNRPSVRALFDPTFVPISPSVQLPQSPVSAAAPDPAAAAANPWHGPQNPPASPKGYDR